MELVIIVGKFKLINEDYNKVFNAQAKKGIAKAYFTARDSLKLSIS